MIIDLILSNRLSEAKELIFAKLNEITQKRLEEAKRYVAEGSFEDLWDRPRNAQHFCSVPN